MSETETVHKTGPFSEEEIARATESALDELLHATPEQIKRIAEIEGLRIVLRGQDFFISIHDLQSWIDRRRKEA